MHSALFRRSSSPPPLDRAPSTKTKRRPLYKSIAVVCFVIIVLAIVGHPHTKVRQRLGAAVDTAGNMWPLKTGHASEHAAAEPETVKVAPRYTRAWRS